MKQNQFKNEYAGTAGSGYQIKRGPVLKVFYGYR